MGIGVNKINSAKRMHPINYILMHGLTDVVYEWVGWLVG